ncbi:NAD(P)/FAD-dependent oxidoreductase [Pararhizobium haloflavum]|uniref:NAD(P)/FAD-dependent oxidoreductase n=1 Tax=Pararhizobium haloflavum TaxID=2037914 RepID=UPI000C18D6C6|nr:FAD-dependent oxidoreductase [Pararhizobium haloflavum]
MEAGDVGSGRRLKVAVIGSGISGASAAWALNPVHDVTLFEKEARPGGHTATVDVDYDGVRIPVDTGFIVYNEVNYPNLTALFAHLGVATHESNMSFSLSLDQGRLEWSGDGLRTLFAQKRNMFRPTFLLMLREILRFNKLCLVDRAEGHLSNMSIGDYLNWRRFSPGFTNNYLIPMAAAIWSSPTNRMLDFPAERFVAFFDNHRLVYRKQLPWRTVTGGARTYLDALLAPLSGRIRLNCAVRSIRRAEGKVHILDASGHESIYDRVVIAAHSNQALAMLDDANETEQSILGAIPYRPNRVILHRDPKLMPKRKQVWSSWNYLRSSRGDGEGDVAVSYWMNRLQGIDRRHPLFVTLNPDREPESGTVFGEYSYEHPQFGTESCQAQLRLRQIQGRNGTFFAGAWTGYGFHEDGLTSGLAAAEMLGGVIPWRQDGDAQAAFMAAAE